MKLLGALLRVLLLLAAVSATAFASDIQSSDWSETDASNSQTPPKGWPAGMNPSQVEPSARAMMGATKRFYDHVNATVTSAGNINAQTLTYSVTPTALVTGDTFTFKVGRTTNTGAVTLNVGVGGDLAIQAGGLPLIGGELGFGRIVTVVYDGTQFQLINMGAAPTCIDARQFGVTVSGDSTAAAQAALDAAYNGGNPSCINFPSGFNFTKDLATYAGICVYGGGINNPWHRTQAGKGLYTALDPSHKSYPTANVADPCIQNVTIIADGGLAGANLVIAWSAEYHLKNVNSFGTDTAAAQANATISGSTLTVLSSLLTANINAGGSGYVANEIVTLAGGAFSRAARIIVNTVNGSGAILTFYIIDSGGYSTTTSSLTQGSTTGVGTGATLSGATFGLNQGTIAVGQMVICRLCGTSGDANNANMTNNSYPTILSGPGGGGAGSYTLSNTFNTAVSYTPMVFSTPWTWTTGQNSSFPSANFVILGLSEGEWIGGAMGNTAIPPLTTCSSFSGIGLALDSIYSSGASKPNNNHFTGVKDWCQILGLASYNGSDNTFVATLHQNTVIGELCGTGNANCQGNISTVSYYEPQSVAPVGQGAIIDGPNSSDNRHDSLGSLTFSYFPNVIWENSVTSNNRNEVRLKNDQTFHGSAVVHTFYSGANTGNVPPLPNLKSFMIDGDDTHHVELPLLAYQAGETAIFSGMLRHNPHASTVAGIGSNELIAVFGARGHDGSGYCGASSSAPGGLPCGYMGIFSDSGTFGAGSWPTRIEFWTTPNGSTTAAKRFSIDSSGALFASGLSAHGAGTVAANWFFAPLTSWANNTTCDAGDAVWDASYIYICTAANTVKRVALSAF